MSKIDFDISPARHSFRELLPNGESLFASGAVDPRRLVLMTAFMCCLMSSLPVLVDYINAGKFANDFGVYWRAAHQPLGEIYFWTGSYPFPYAPTMLLWIQPLALLPKWTAYILFAVSSLAAFVLVVRRYLPRNAVVLCLVSAPFVRGLFTGQVCALLAALLIWACGSRNRVAAGMVLAVIASVKPQLVILAPLMLIFSRDWRAFVAAGVTFAGIVLLSLALFGVERWPEWIASMDHFHHAVSDTNILLSGTTPMMFAERYGFPTVPFLLLGMVTGVAIVWKCRDAGPLEKASAIAAGSMFAVPYALAYDMTAVLPMLALAVVNGRVLGAFAISTGFQPMPLLVTALDLLRQRRRAQEAVPDQAPAIESLAFDRTLTAIAA